MRKIPFSIIKRLNKLLRPTYSIVKRHGIRLMLNKFNWIDNRLLCFRRYEEANVNAMLTLAREHSFDSFFDIGANIGYFSCMIAKHTSIETVMAYEPLKRNYYQLCSNVLLNGFEARIHCHNIALGDKNEETTIWFNHSSTGIATLDKQATPRDKGDYTNSEVIQSKMCDEIYDISGKMMLIKMDVEGFEARTLKGMEQFLSNNRVVLFVEINQDEQNINTLLANYGFQQLQIDADDFVFSNFVS